MEQENALTILKGEALEAQTRAEVDITIATAKSYPRNVKSAIAEMEAIATQDKETAAACFYSLPRGGKVITGESVRLAEIVVNCWGNINAGYRVIANDGKTITAQAVCHDLEKNVRITSEVIKRITNKDGKIYNEDMQIVTGNAAGSTAFRNAVFKVIPKALISGLLEKVKDVSIGKSMDIETRRGKAIDHFKKLGITEKEIITILGVSSVEDIGRDEILTLLGLTTALKDGETTLDEAFGRNKKSSNSKSTPNNIFGETKEAVIVEDPLEIKESVSEPISQPTDSEKEVVSKPKKQAKQVANDSTQTPKSGELAL